MDPDALDIGWAETLPGDGYEDYTGYHKGKYIGRVYKRLRAGFNPNLWQWNLGWGGPDPQGLCASRYEALLVVEIRYARHLARKR